MKESTFQSKVIAFLHSYNVYVVNVWGGGYQRAGIPDLLCCINGRFVAIELKTETGRTSKLQDYNIEQIRKSNGQAFVLRPSGFKDFQNWVRQEVDKRHDGASSI